MPGSFRIGKIAGIDIFIHVSWLIIIVLLTWSLATGWFPVLYPGWSTITYWVVSLIAALLLFVAVLVHELAHSLVARARGLQVKNITLFIFGGISNIEQEPQTPGVEFQMAFVGPLTSLVIGGVAYLLLVALGNNTSPLAAILIPISVLRDHSKMGEVGHRTETLRVGFQLIESFTHLVNHGIKRGKSEIRELFFA